MANETDLADRDLRVLELVEKYPQPIVTTIREALYWADKNQHVHYRLDKLEKRGLVETWKDEETETRGHLKPRRATTTEAGAALLNDVEHDEDGGSVEERLEWIEKRLEQFEETYGAMKRRVVEAEEELEDHDEEMCDVREDLERLQRLMEDEPMAVTAEEFTFNDD